MTIVYCNFEYCAYNTNGVCTKDRITIGDEYADVCDDFLRYQDTEEYSHSFYKAVKTENGVVAKGLCERAKRIEYQGFVFYTEERIFDDEMFRVTEERTGVSCGDFAMLKQNFDKFKERVEKYPNVQDYPLAEYNGLGKWKLKENEVTENE